MATKKELREQAREQRRQAEAKAAEDARRKRLVQFGAVAFFAALVVVGVLIVVSQSGSDSGGDSGSIEGADRIAAELKGVPQDGTTLGDPGATVSITEYGDLQCPVCAAFSEQVVPSLIDHEIKSGDARMEFKNFTIIGPDSETAAKASLAAAEQGRYWQFIELFYANQGPENSGYVTDDFLTAVAEGAGVPEIDKFNADREDPALDQRVAAVQSEAADLGLNSTPSLVVEGPSGSKTLVSPTLAELQQAIEAVG